MVSPQLAHCIHTVFCSISSVKAQSTAPSSALQRGGLVLLILAVPSPAPPTPVIPARNSSRHAWSAALVTPTEVRSHSTELQDFIAPLQKSVGINLKNKNERSLAFIASLTRTNATILNRVSSINYTGQRSNPRIT